MLRLTISLVGLVVCVGSGCAQGTGGAPRQTLVVSEDTTGISVVGEGKTEATPDEAVFSVGVEVRKPTVAEARNGAAETMQALLAALRSAGVEEGHIQTRQISVAPDYEYSESGRRLLGYVATNTVEVSVRELDDLGSIIDAAVRAGGDSARLEGIRFELSDPDAAKAEAREEAVERARSDAEQLARLLGVELGEALSVEEMAAEGPHPVMMQAEMARDEAATPIEPGRTEVSVRVRVRWAIAAN